MRKYLIFNEIILIFFFWEKIHQIVKFRESIV